MWLRILLSPSCLYPSVLGELRAGVYLFYILLELQTIHWF